MEKMRKKVNRHLYAMQGSFVGSTGILMGYSVVLLQSKNLNPTEIGVAMALSTAFAIFLQPLVAAFSNRHRNVSLKTVMAFLNLVGLIGAAGLYFITSQMALVTLCYVVIAAICNSMLTLIGAYAMEFENRGMKVNFGISRGVGSLAFAIVGFIAGQIIENFGARWILPMYGAIMVVVIWTTARHITPKEAMPTPAQGDVIETASVKIKARELVRGKPYMVLFFLALFCISYNHTMLDSYQVNVIQSVNGSTSNYGTMMLIMALCEMPSLFLCNRLMKRFGCGAMITGAMIMFLAKDVLLILAQDVTLIYIAQACNLGTVGMYMPAMVYMTNELVEPEYNVSAQAFFAGVGAGLGKVAANMSGGVLIDMGGVHAMLAATIGTILVGLVLMRRSMWAMRKKGLAIR